MDVEINGEVENLRVNGVDVTPYVEAELDRRDPDRPKMRPTDPDGFRAAWELLERRWAETVDRARTLDPAALHESVDGEWSFTQTLRHLVFATDAWVRRAVLGDLAPYHPLGLPDDSSENEPGVPRDPNARPALDEVLAVRADRQRTVRDYLAGLTDERLASSTTPLTEPGYPEIGAAFPVREVLLTILNEEYLHRQYAERDLDVLTGSGPART
jgi:uncharacterized damage-inducible protein DinB